MRRVLLVTLFVMVFLAGLGILLYPLVSDYINSIKHVQTINEYFQIVETLSQEDFSGLLEAAQRYNESLIRKPGRFKMTEEELVEYRALLNPTGMSILGTLEIEVIDLHLPIYHGTDEGVLQAGLGHLEGSSLPIGGLGTHTVITGHRGLPSSTLLTNIDRLVLGDTFKLHVLNEILIYRVDQIITVEPHETSALAIFPEADYCTLVTCTPYGINTHRLLVRGYRIEGDTEAFVAPRRIKKTEAHVLTVPIAAILIIVPVTFTVLVILFIRLRRVYGRGKKR